MNEQMKLLLSKVKLNTGASTDLINKVNEKFGNKLPQDYLDFLSQANGGNGFIGDGYYLILDSIDELIQDNSNCDVNEYAPGLVIFGSNGGEDYYAFDLIADPLSYVEIPAIELGLVIPKILGHSLEEFLQYFKDFQLHKKA